MCPSICLSGCVLFSILRCNRLCLLTVCVDVCVCECVNRCECVILYY